MSESWCREIGPGVMHSGTVLCYCEHHLQEQIAAARLDAVRKMLDLILKTSRTRAYLEQISDDEIARIVAPKERE